MNSATSSDPSPEQESYSRELSGAIERAVLLLPDDYRLVFMLRDIEGMSTEQTGQSLGLTPENVKVRLHRAHAKLRKHARLNRKSTPPKQSLWSRGPAYRPQLTA